MSKEKKEFLKLSRHSVRMRVKAFRFMEGDFHIMYVPSLNLSSYGKTIQEAEKMMNEAVIPDFCENLTTQKRAFVISELKKLGWERSIFYENDLSKEAYVDIKGILQRFDLDEDTEVTENNISKNISVAC